MGMLIMLVLGRFNVIAFFPEEKHFLISCFRDKVVLLF